MKIVKLDLLLPLVKRIFLGAGIAALFLITACGTSQFTASSGWSGVAVGDKEVYVGTMEGQLVAFDDQRGSRLWDFPRDKGDARETFGAIYGSPSIYEGKIYVAGYNGFVYAIDAKTQRPDSEFEIPGDVVNRSIISDVIISNGKAVFGSGSDLETGHLHVRDANDLAAESGACRYPRKGTIGKVWASPLVIDGVAYFGDFNHFLYAVSIDDCSLVWSAPVKLGGAIGATPFFHKGTIYVGSFDRTFYAVDALTGSARSLFEAQGWFWSGIASDGKRLFIPSLDGFLYAMDIETEEIIWSEDTGGPIRSTPIVIPHADLNQSRVVVASNSGKLYVLFSGSGNRDDIINLDDDKDIEAPLSVKLTKQGPVVYFIDQDHRIHAINLDAGDYLNQRWPKSTKDDD